MTPGMEKAHLSDFLVDCVGMFEGVLSHPHPAPHNLTESVLRAEVCHQEFGDFIVLGLRA